MTGSATVAQIVTVPLMLVGKSLCSFIPYWVLTSQRGAAYFDSSSSSTPQRGPILLSWANCFSAGVFLATCFVGLLPSVEEKYHRTTLLMTGQNTTQTQEDHEDYPVPEVTICIGFFLIWGLELILHTCVSSCCGDRKAAETKNSEYGSLGSHDGSKAILDNESAEETEGTNSGSLVKGILLTAALSAHSVFEGVGFGLMDNLTQVLNLMVAMLVHECLCAFALGVHLAKSRDTPRCAAMGMLALFAVLVPLGIVWGLLLNAQTQDTWGGQLAAMILQGVAAGTFLYVVFLEVLPQEFKSDGHGHSHHAHMSEDSHSGHSHKSLMDASIWRMICCLLGFALIAILRLYI